MPWPKGKPRSEETKRKIAESTKLALQSDDVRRRMSESSLGNVNAKGNKLTAEHKQAIRNAMIGNTHLLGHVHTEASKRKMSDSTSGENHPCWKGGISAYQGFTDRLKQLIRSRDGNECVLCGEIDNGKKGLHVHHIDFTKTNHSNDNLITLCSQCHKDVHAGKVAIYSPIDWEELN